MNGQVPVYLIDCTGKEKGHVLVGYIPARLIPTLYRMCENEFDWMCGLEDSGFDEHKCVVYLDDSWGVLECAWQAIKVHEFVTKLGNAWNNPCHILVPRDDKAGF